MKHKFITNTIAAVFLATGLFSCSKNEQFPLFPPDGSAPPPATFNWTNIADSAQLSLSQFYNVTGKYYTLANNSTSWTEYWPTAHTLDVLVDAYLRTKSDEYLNKMNDLLTGMKAKNGNTWLNHYYDDMEWMALASLRAFEVTGDAKYKTIAEELWIDLKNGWSNDLGGGIWWSKDRGSKNTPSNMPAAIFAARLYTELGKAEGLTWAKKIYEWEKAILYDAGSGWVKDHITAAGVVHPTWKFTYNQGTFAGAAYELYNATGEAQYLNDAVKAIDYAISNLTKNGILQNEGGGNGGLFKGILIRYLTKMISGTGLTADKKKTYAEFVKINAQTLWSLGTNKQSTLFNTAWDAMPGTQTDLTTQLSGIMLMEAAAMLKKNNLF